MEQEKLIVATNEQDVWQQLEADLANYAGEFEYRATIQQYNRQIQLNIDIDPGGGFEGGYERTSLTTPFQTDPGFRFAIHREGFLDEIGKLFGMQDVELGYAEFDSQLVVKTNDADKTRLAFANITARKLFQSLEGYVFRINPHHIPGTETKAAFLELQIEEGITDINLLQQIYRAFITVLAAIEPA